MASELVFDLGLNTGDDTAFYLSQGYRVVSVEADPTLAEAARKRFHREIEQNRLQILNVGIAKEDGFADFWICDDKSQFNSFDRRIAARNSYKHHSIRIPTKRFATLLKEYGMPYYLKIDIEGNDQLCLDDLSPTSRPRFISLESECPEEEVMTGADEGLRALARLRDLGYRQFKLIDQLTFCSLSDPPSLNDRVDRIARRVLQDSPMKGFRGAYRLACYLVTRNRLERKFGREFPIGCSGVFGEDTPGKWISYEEAERAYRYYREMHFKNSAAQPYSFWCDWHAKM